MPGRQSRGRRTRGFITLRLTRRRKGLPLAVVPSVAEGLPMVYGRRVRSQGA